MKEPLFSEKSLHVQTKKPELSDEVNQKLLELEEKGIDINELILETLKRRELEIAQEKEQIAPQLIKTNSRYIPVKIRKIIQKRIRNKMFDSRLPKII